MTEIEIIGSSSQANGYLLKSAGEILVLELGCRFMDYVEALKEDFNAVVGCLVSHKHSDHLNRSTVCEFYRRGIETKVGDKVYSDLFKTYAGSVLSWIRDNTKARIGNFTVQTFEVPHNVPNYGFLIKTPTNERILFVTDTTGVNLRFRDINAIMVECNNDDDTLLDNLANNDVSMSHPEYHLGLNDCAEFCKQNISASTKQIILIHLSHTNVNEAHAIQTVKERCNFDNVAVAHKGDKFIIENDDF